MRPVKRGGSPQATDFSNYEDAKHHLVSRLGPYCSYCERRVATNLAVEHIQPKGLPAYVNLIGRWDNFLLGCVNCNSTKKDKDVVLANVLFPDRDNTFAAFEYSADGLITTSKNLNQSQSKNANELLGLVGLDKPMQVFLDENDKQVALDRVAQRMEVWGIALEAKSDVDGSPGISAVRRGAVRTAQGHGFFSIWMTVFASDNDMCNLLIKAFSGTLDSGCFDPATSQSITPAPNPDMLANGGKV